MSTNIYEDDYLTITKYVGPADPDISDRTRYQFTTPTQNIDIDAITYGHICEWLASHDKTHKSPPKGLANEIYHAIRSWFSTNAVKSYGIPYTMITWRGHEYLIKIERWS